MAKSKKRTAGLDKKLEQLRQYRGQLTKEANDLLATIQTWPVETIEAYGQKIPCRTILNEQVHRTHSDLLREKGRIEHEIRQVESLLYPTKGRPADPIYEQALRDLNANPQLTIRQLAEKHFPSHFPDRQEYAIAQMEQGLRRVRRRKPTK